jgi:parvulin-like peptidyl-prolyl isomerase
MKRQTFILATAALAVLLATPASGTTINKILATVDGEPVTLYQLRKYGERTIRGRQISSATDESGLLDALITDKLIEKEVSDKGIVVREEDVERYIEGIKERNKLDDRGLQQALAAQGLTPESYRAQIRAEIQKAQLMNREIRGKVNVTPEDVQRYYEKHLAEYSTPERLQIAHILFRLDPDAPPDMVAAVTAKAQEVYGRLKKGADFAEMAQQYTEDPSGAHGGDLGWFKSGQMLDELEKAAARLKVGEISEPVRTKLGIHIVKLQGREDASHQKLDDLADQIKERLYNAALEERFQKWLTDDLRRRHDVEMRQ